MATAKAKAGARSALAMARRRTGRAPSPTGGVTSGVEATPHSDDPDAYGQQAAQPDHQRHEPFRHGAVAAQCGAAPIVRGAEVLHVGGDILGVLGAEGGLVEDRHLTWTDAHRL